MVHSNPGLVFTVAVERGVDPDVPSAGEDGVAHRHRLRLRVGGSPLRTHYISQHTDTQLRSGCDALHTRHML
jgi:hypothetical protein